MAILLWDGNAGGTEMMHAGLAAAIRGLGASAEMVFVNRVGSLADRLAAAGVPFHVLGCRRGRDVLRHPRRYAAAIGAVGPDGVLLPERGFMASALRLGGYRGRIVAVEHGSLILAEPSRWRDIVKRANMRLGAWSDDLDVGVSDFMVARMREGPHAARMLRIYNGIDPAHFAGAASALPPAERGMTIGFAGRLIRGKGVDDAILAVARAAANGPLRLLIAGEGPERPRLEALARTVGVNERVDFLGLVRDIRQFWAGCHVAIFPSHQFIESFGMTGLEAMACARPVVATRNGGIPEVVAHGVAGTLVEPGDVTGLAEALVTYADREDLRCAHGEAGRARAAERFHIRDCARAYLECFEMGG
ncbi:MAG: glycosyltransferase family 4 protein [Actinobacteria bacterium]|nr:glycosyltransferase family 4 protein [Actinomycetota bacterium]